MSRFPGSRYDQVSAWRRRRELGFTILEMLVALAIVALMLGLAATRFGSSRPRLGVEVAARSIANELRVTRDAAIRSNSVTGLLIDASGRHFGPFDGAAKSLPPDIEVEVAKGGVAGRSQLRILFYADGSSSGGKILLRRGADWAEVDVDWVTGFAVTRAPG